MIGRFREWLERRRAYTRARKMITIATKDDFTTKVTDDSGKKIRDVHHYVAYQIDGYGVRSADVKSTDKDYVPSHNGLQTSIFNWAHHADLPVGCRMVDNERVAQFKMFWGSPDV